MADLRDQLRDAVADIGQAEIARRTGIPQPSISAWLAGTRGLPFARQVVVAEACGFQITVKLTRKKNGPAPASRQAPAR